MIYESSVKGTNFNSDLIVNCKNIFELVQGAERGKLER